MGDVEFPSWARRRWTIQLALLASDVLMLGGATVLIAAGIKAESRGPVFYRQERVGRGGKPLFMYRFRSMRDGADPTPPARSRRIATR